MAAKVQGIADEKLKSARIIKPSLRNIWVVEAAGPGHQLGFCYWVAI